MSAFLTGLCDVSPVTAFDALHVGKKLLATLGTATWYSRAAVY